MNLLKVKHKHLQPVSKILRDCTQRSFLSIHNERAFHNSRLPPSLRMEPTSPSSGGLFFSSSPTQTSPGPAEEASILVAQALQDNQVDQVLEDIVLENSHTFFEIFHRRVQLIKSRSQAFQDCHVTVFDKALLELTQNGNDLRNASAVSFFCEEHLGIPVSAEFIHKEEFLPNILFVPKTVNQGKNKLPNCTSPSN